MLGVVGNGRRWPNAKRIHMSKLPAILFLFVHCSLASAGTEPTASPTYASADPARPYKWLGPGSESRIVPGKQPLRFVREFKREPIAGGRILVGYHAIYEDSTISNEPVDPQTGERIVADIDFDSHMKNKGGTDGAGLCVPTSVNMAAFRQAVSECYDLQAYCTKFPGGSYPQKFDDTIRRKTNGKFKEYLNVTGREQCRELCRVALASGRAVGTTYGYSPRPEYRGEAIAHMVTLVHLKGGRAAILDNNFPGTYEWMSEEEFWRRQEMMGGPWVLALTGGSLPPPARIEVK